MAVTADMQSKTFSLVITGLTESDFCGTTVNSDVLFADPIRLQIEDELTLTERVLIFSGVGLAVFVFFLVMIIAGRNIYYHGWQKGWTAAEHASLTDQKSQK